MKGLEFPIIGTKVKGLSESFDTSDINSRKKYFQAKVGDEIARINKYLKTGTFMAFMVGKKNSGKGTYSNMMAEVFGNEKIGLISVGDLVREVHGNWEFYKKSDEFNRLKSVYRGFISFDEAVERLHGRSTSNLLPTEFILALLKARLPVYAGKAVLVDGLPRDVDQISYSLFFRDLANVRDDPDMFVLIDIPMAVIDERIKYRLVCPICKTSRNMKLLVTKDITYDTQAQKFLMRCDNPMCKREIMLPKEGDNKGIDPIKARLIKDEEIIRSIFGLHGMPKILLRNHLPAAEAKKYFDNYEITPEFVLKWNEKKEVVEVGEKPWTILDDNGVKSNSLMAAPVVVTLVKQLADVLEV